MPFLGVQTAAYSAGHAGRACDVALGIVLLAVVSEHRPDLGDGGEVILVQALVAQFAVEALDEAVLDRVSRPAAIGPDASGVGPLVEREAHEFGAVVDDDRGRRAARGPERLEGRCDPIRPEARIEGERQRLRGEGAHDGQGAEAPAIDRGVAREIHRLADIGRPRTGVGDARSRGTIPSLPPDREPFCPIEPADPLVIVPDSGRAQRPEEHREAPPGMLGGQRPELLAERLVVGPPGAIPLRTAVHAEPGAGTSLTPAVGWTEATMARRSGIVTTLFPGRLSGPGCSGSDWPPPD